MNYFFIMGNHPCLSLAEIQNCLPPLKYSRFAHTAFITELENNLDLEHLQKQLGGTIKTGKILRSFYADEFNRIIPFLIEIITGQTKHKARFGISVYYDSTNNKSSHLKKQFSQLGLRCKKQLKEHGISARFVTSQKQEKQLETALSSVVVQKNQLLKEDGYEFVVMEIDHMFWLGKTQTVQPFEEYSSRDYGRPSRDAKSGMIPPKLAQIMINLAAQNPDSSAFFDPFCGSGTFTQEALLLGYKNIFASDSSQEALNNTKRNLEWLLTQKPLPVSIQIIARPQSREAEKATKDAMVRLFQSDAQHLKTIFRQPCFDAVVTEPYMGPATVGNASTERLKTIISGLDSLYVKTLQSLSSIIKKTGRLVIVFPVFHVHGEEFRLRFAYQFQRLGFSPVHFSLNGAPLPPLIYSRLDQTIKREIIVLEPLV